MVLLCIDIHLLSHLVFRQISPQLLPWYNTHHRTAFQTICRKAHRQIILLSRIFFNFLRELFFVHLDTTHSNIYQSTFHLWDATISCSHVLPYSTFPHHFTNLFVNVITVPPKIWRSKAKNKYKPVIYIDVNDDMYVLKTYGKAMTRLPRWLPRPRNDLILWDSISFTA